MSMKKAPATTNLHGIDAEMARVVPASATAILLFAEMMNVDQPATWLDLRVIYDDSKNLRSWVPSVDNLSDIIEKLFFDEYENDKTIRFLSVFVKGGEVSLVFGYDRDIVGAEISSDRVDAAILHHFGRPWVTPPMEVEYNPQQVVVHNDWDWDDEPE